jgi:hypothetical protein
VEFKLRLLQFLNNIYTETFIPDGWRNAIVITLFKKGNTRDSKDYKGIGILNTSYNIYSKILNMKLHSHSEEFMTEAQNGFRMGHSCTDPTFCLKLLIEKRTAYNLETYLLFVDYEKAFGSTQRQILFDILKFRNIPDTLLKAIVDICTQNKISVKCNSKLLKPAEINKGVCRGCRLSPTLFNIYLDELITKWQKEDITGIPLSKNQQLFNLLLADDQVTISKTKNNLQKATHKLNQIVTEHGLTISVQKTNSMTFKGRDPVRSKIVIDNKIIEQVNSFNYLGNLMFLLKKKWTLITN